MKTEKEVYIAACGVDEDGNSKSVVSIETEFINLKDNSEEPVERMSLDGVSVNIFRALQHTTVDFTFADGMGYDIVQAVNMLKRFSVPGNSVEDDGDRIACIAITIMPKELEGEYFICGLHAIWCLMSSVIGQKSDTIRFIIDNQLFKTYATNAAKGEEDDDSE